jgi:hypothetical protein
MVKELIEKLRDLEADDAEFDAKFYALMENVTHQVEEEESEMFPQVEEVLEAPLEDLMDEMQELKHQPWVWHLPGRETPPGTSPPLNGSAGIFPRCHRHKLTAYRRLLPDARTPAVDQSV